MSETPAPKHDKSSTAIDRCACGKYPLEAWCGTYATPDWTHTRERCYPDPETPAPMRPLVSEERIRYLLKWGPQFACNPEDLHNALHDLLDARAANRDLREALQEAFDYFDQRADITDSGVANECARLRETLRAALERAGEGDKP